MSGSCPQIRTKNTFVHIASGEDGGGATQRPRRWSDADLTLRCENVVRKLEEEVPRVSDPPRVSPSSSGQQTSTVHGSAPGTPEQNRPELLSPPREQASKDEKEKADDSYLREDTVRPPLRKSKSSHVSIVTSSPPDSFIDGVLPTPPEYLRLKASDKKSVPQAKLSPGGLVVLPPARMGGQAQPMQGADVHPLTGMPIPLHSKIQQPRRNVNPASPGLGVHPSPGPLISPAHMQSPLFPSALPRHVGGRGGPQMGMVPTPSSSDLFQPLPFAMPPPTPITSRGMEERKEVREDFVSERERQSREVVRTHSLQSLTQASGNAGQSGQLMPPVLKRHDSTKSRRESASQAASAFIPGGKNTTVMFRNIPNKYSPRELYEAILTQEPSFRTSIDLFYLPTDFGNQCSLGYAFINFVTPEEADRFFGAFHERRLGNEGRKSRNVEVSLARVQGLENNVSQLRNSQIMVKLADDFKPMLFHGGKEVPFPEPEIPDRVRSGASVAQSRRRSSGMGGGVIGGMNPPNLPGGSSSPFQHVHISASPVTERSMGFKGGLAMGQAGRFGM